MTVICCQLIKENRLAISLFDTVVIFVGHFLLPSLILWSFAKIARWTQILFFLLILTELMGLMHHICSTLWIKISMILTNDTFVNLTNHFLKRKLLHLLHTLKKMHILLAWKWKLCNVHTNRLVRACRIRRAWVTHATATDNERLFIFQYFWLTGKYGCLLEGDRTFSYFIIHDILMTVSWNSSVE